MWRLVYILQEFHALNLETARAQLWSIGLGFLIFTLGEIFVEGTNLWKLVFQVT